MLLDSIKFSMNRLAVYRQTQTDSKGDLNLVLQCKIIYVLGVYFDISLFEFTTSTSELMLGLN